MVDKKNLIEKINTHTKNNRISCKQALQIAEEEQVSPKVIGETLNEMKIKVVTCQLGCFP